ncbi:MAG: biopolymer transporter ExbD [Fibrobacter sp.]|nr:biopolymer transporter ExbD [Fibrobacter sp.]
MKARDLHKGLDKGGTFRPQLTSLVDIMVILLFFLIQSFSVEGNLVTPSTDLELPLSDASKSPQPYCNLHITQTQVLVDDEVIVTNQKIASSEDFMIPELFKMMKAQAVKNKDSLSKGKLIIQADKEIPFAIVKKVMFTCSKAGFDDFKVLVVQEE